jgi:hypothetical protein
LIHTFVHVVIYAGGKQGNCRFLDVYLSGARPHDSRF